MSLIQVSRPVSTSQLLGCVPNRAELLSITNVQSCEFGACGPGPTGFSPSSVGANFSQIKIDPQAAFFFGALWYGTSGRNGTYMGFGITGTSAAQAEKVCQLTTLTLVACSTTTAIFSEVLMLGAISRPHMPRCKRAISRFAIKPIPCFSQVHLRSWKRGPLSRSWSILQT
jgi:hypothetical protein